MPADADSLAALGELASTASRAPLPSEHADDQVTVAVRRPGSRARDPRSPVRTAGGTWTSWRRPSSLRDMPQQTRLVVLGAVSVAAGLLAGLVVPVASAAPAPSASSTPTVLALPTARPAAPPASSGKARQRAAAPAAEAVPARAAQPRAVASAPAVTPSTPAAARSMPPAAPASTLAAGLPAAAAAAGIAWPAQASGPASPSPTVRTTASPAEPPPTRPSAETVAAARAYKPTKKLPAASGTGRRIVYSQHRGHLWIVGPDGRVVRDYPVTGRIGRPAPGSYRVFSKSRTAVNPVAKVRFDLMVRFAHGVTGAAIGFHTIPRWYDGRPLQKVSQLGQMIGAGGCVRQSTADARWLYAWSRIGDRVVVLG